MSAAHGARTYEDLCVVDWALHAALDALERNRNELDNRRQQLEKQLAVAEDAARILRQECTRIAEAITQLEARNESCQ